MIYIVKYYIEGRGEYLAYLESNSWNEALDKSSQVVDNLNKNVEDEQEYRLVTVQKIDTLPNWS